MMTAGAGREEFLGTIDEMRDEIIDAASKLVQIRSITPCRKTLL